MNESNKFYQMRPNMVIVKPRNNKGTAFYNYGNGEILAGELGAAWTIKEIRGMCGVEITPEQARKFGLKVEMKKN